MSNNIFSAKRFMLLAKQHFTHNAQFLLLSVVAYVGVIFIVLSITQVGSDLEQHRVESFQGFLVAFTAVFGILYVGYSFPAFRSKESTISYLMLPASELEKFTFEFVSRICLVIIVLPILYWLTFNLQGYFFTIISRQPFEPVGIQYLVRLDVAEEYRTITYFVITAGVLFIASLAFTGAAMFSKQPLVKSLFAVAVIVAFFVGYSFLIVTQFDIEDYTPGESMYLIPLDGETAAKWASVMLFLGTAVMLLVAYRKLKEREV